MTRLQMRWLRLALLFFLRGICLADGPSQDWISLTPQELEVRRIALTPSDYSAVKEFFTKVRANDGLQAVFQQKDQKQN